MQFFWAGTRVLADRTIGSGSRMAQPTYQQLLKVIADKDRQLARQQSRIEQLEAQVRRLTAQLQQVLRANKRQAAPFSKGPPKDPPRDSCPQT